MNSFAFPLLSAAAGAAGGWLVSTVAGKTEVSAANRGQSASSRPESNAATRLRVFVSAIAALLFAALAVKLKAPGPRFFVYSGLILVLIGVTIFDLRTRLIPHAITIPGTAAGLILGSFVLPIGLRDSILGLLIGGGTLLVASFVEALRKKEIGGGDWKYAAMIGSFIGPQRIVIALVLTGVFGAIGGIALVLSGNYAKPHALGPWLSAGAVASILIG